MDNHHVAYSDMSEEQKKLVVFVVQPNDMDLPEGRQSIPFMIYDPETGEKEEIVFGGI